MDGISDFNALHSRQYDDEVQLCAFDILAMGGHDLRHSPTRHGRPLGPSSFSIRKNLQAGAEVVYAWTNPLLHKGLAGLAVALRGFLRSF